MSKNIDDRIVQMQFNNRQFESGVKTTMGTLEKLKSALNMKGATKGLTSLSTETKRFSIQGLNGLISGVETISSRFTAMGIMGVEALRRIANAALDAGQNMVKSLTIAPISAGYSDYNAKLTSVQTIMNATGKDINVVSAYFKELDTYADKTIYNLGDMTSAFAKFTNAGVDMSKSIPAIKGIANMTALAGQDAGAASIAMYNLSQSIAGGFLTTMDYKSLNLANIATLEWKTNMANAAVAAGKLKKDAKGMYLIPGAKQAVSLAQLFTEELSTGWASTDVILKVLGDYADTTKDVGKRAQAAAQDVKSFGMMMETLGAAVGTGWTDTFELLIGDLHESKKLFTGLTNTIGGFLDTMADNRNAMLDYWKTVGGRTVLLETLADLFNKLDLILLPIRYSFRELFPKATADTLVELTYKFKYMIQNFTVGIEAIYYIGKIFKGVFAALSIGKQIIVALAKNVIYLFKKLKPAGKQGRDFLATVADWLVALDEALKKGDTFNKFFQKVADVLAKIINNITTCFLDFLDSFDLFNTADTKGVATFVDDVQNQFKPLESIGQFFTKAWTTIQTVWPKIKTFFAGAWTVIKEGFKQLGIFLGKVGAEIGPALKNLTTEDAIKILQGGLLAGILAGVLKVVQIIKGFAEGAKSMVKGVTGVLDTVREAIETYQKNIKADTIKKIATAIAILAVSIFLLSLIKTEKLAASLAAVTALITELFVSMVVFEKLAGKEGFKTIKKVSTAMLILGLAILVLTSAIKKLGRMDPAEMGQGLLGVAGAIIGFIAFLRLAKFDEGAFIKQTIAMLVLALAVNALGNAVKKFGEMNPDVLVQGMFAVGSILVGFAGLSYLLNKEGNMLKSAIGVFMMAAAMSKLTEAVIVLGSLDEAVLNQGLKGLGFSLGIVVTALNMMPKKMLNTGSGFAALAVGLMLMANALKLLGEMDPVRLTQGLLGLGIALGLIVVLMNAMTAGLAGAFAVLLVSAALFGLATVLAMLAMIPLEKINTGLYALVMVLGILGLAAAVIGPFAGLMAALGGGLIVMGIGLLAIGGGLIVLAMGVSALAIACVPGVPALVLLTAGLLGIVLLLPGILALSPSLIVLAAAMTVFGVGAIIAGAGALVGGFGFLMLAGGLAALTQVDFEKLSSINDYAGDIFKASGKLLLAAPGLLAGGKGLQEFGEGAMTTGNGLALVRENLMELVNEVKAVPGDITEAGQMITTALFIAIAALNAMLQVEKQKVEQILNATVKDTVDAIRDKRYLWYNSGEYLVDGFIQAIRNKVSEAAQAASSMAVAALRSANQSLEINSPSGAFEDTAKFSVLGLVQGFKKYTKLAEKASESLGTATLTPVMSMAGARSTSAGIRPTSQNSNVSSIATGLQNGSPMQRTMDGLSSLMANANNTQGVDLSGTLTIQVANDKGEIISIVHTAVRDILRRESR